MVERMSGETFTQIIFPPKPKPKPPVSTVTNTTFPKNSAYIQDEVFCMPANHWIPMYECVFCKNPKRKLEEILESGLGC